MQRLLGAWVRLWGGVERLGEVLIVALTLAMIAASLAQVLARYLFSAPLSWSEELSRYLFIWLSFLAAWFAWRHRVHIGLDLLPPRLLRPFARLSEALILAFAIISMVYGNKLMALAMNQPSAALGIPMAAVYAGYYAGMILIAGDTLASWARAALGLAQPSSAGRETI